ncbi:MAG: tol-pal system-associated acyl-CoA thioesterase [Luteimonas sp.]
MSMRAEPVFSIATRVYWEDTDAGGVVYHAQYLAFLERARSDWMRALGYGQEILRGDHDLLFAVRAMRIDFRKPARLDDTVRVSVALRECRRASLIVAQAIDLGGVRLLDAEVRVAALGARDFRPRPIPESLHKILKPLETYFPAANKIEAKQIEANPIKPGTE